MDTLKIFLSYHKNTPIYKSHVFQPIKVGGGTLEGCLTDDIGDNISKLNPYYCELTGHYWVLKNYLNNCNEKYIGFAHYRRLPDLTNITCEDIPAIYGLNYSDSIRLFDKLNTSNLFELCQNYDIILPCSCYMYEHTVNPELRSTEPHYNTYEHFKTEHKNDLLDILNKVIETNYPEFIQGMKDCYNSDKSHFYNIYIMKTDIMADFLNFMFNSLEKVGTQIGGWEQEKYKRMAGFVGETITNIWINYHKQSLKIGYSPIYMVDFEIEYIEKANLYNQNKLYKEEKIELEKLLKVTSDKFNVYCALIHNSINTNNRDDINKYKQLAAQNAKDGEDFYNLANLLPENEYMKDICEYYQKAISIEPSEKMYAKAFLNYTEKTHDISLTKIAWDELCKFELNDNETEKYKHFKKIYSMVNAKL